MHNPQQQDIQLNLGSVFITSDVIGSSFFSFPTSVTCDLLNCNTSYPISTIWWCWTWFTTRNPLLENFKGNYNVQRNLPGIPVINQTHPIQTLHLILLIMTFVLSSNHYGAAQPVQWLGHKLEDLRFKSWQKQDSYVFSKISRPAPAPTQCKPVSSPTSV